MEKVVIQNSQVVNDDAVNLVSEATPKQIVEFLNRFVIGQDKAKRAVAIALRNRWRYSKLSLEMQKAVIPKNMMFIGRTGVGKTEIMRRFTIDNQYPFIKVEATKFTEVGYVGRDVESIIRDLTQQAVDGITKSERERVFDQARKMAIEDVLDVLMVNKKKDKSADEGADGEKPLDLSSDSFTSSKSGVESSGSPSGVDSDKSSTRDYDVARVFLRQKLLAGGFDDREIDIKLPTQSRMGMEIFAPYGMEEVITQIQSAMETFASKRSQTVRMKVKDALARLTEERASAMLDGDKIREIAVKKVETKGIVFIDEIDKIVGSGGSDGGGNSSSPDVSRGGVQRDLLPLIEGTVVTTKYGPVRTDKILFIVAGAFHTTKPSDLIPELQGRFPIRVIFDDLTVDDFEKILVEPQYSLTEQYAALLATENVKVVFVKSAIRRLSEIAYRINETTENIGARRLHTVLEKVFEDISFNACESPKKKVVRITAEYVDKALMEIVKNVDWSREIL